MFFRREDAPVRKIFAVMTTVNNAAFAEKMARICVGRKLAACAQFFPMTSIYRWKGKMEKSGEILVLFKTSPAKRTALMREIKKLHVYELPEIVGCVLDASSKEYAKWIIAGTM